MTIQVRSHDPFAPKAPEAKAEGVEAQEQSEAAKSAPEAVDASEQESASESETEETEAKEVSETEESPDEEGETEAKAQDDGTPVKKKGGFQRRIDKLNAAKTAARQEAEYWKREALKNATAPKTEAPKVETAALTSDAQGKPNPDTFDTHAEYVEALTDWKIEQRDREREQKAQQAKLMSEQERAAQTYQERLEAFKAKTPDFEDVEAELDDALISARMRPSPALTELILSSENGPELAYELAKTPDEFIRICKLPPLAAAREVGKLESRLAPKAAAETKTETKKLTNAPKPLEPVKAGGKGSATKSIHDPNLSQTEYEALRREQLKRKGIA